MTPLPQEYTPAKSGITLYSAGTPNGLKVSMALEILGLPYKLCDIDRTNNMQRAPWYIEHINPVGLIPALIDNVVDPVTGTTQTTRIFESGAIIMYLADKYDTPAHKISYAKGTPHYYESLQWMFYQLAGVEAMQGPATFYTLNYPDVKKLKFVGLFTAQVKRMYRVLETQLKKNGSGFLVGPHISIADIVALGWIYACPVLNIDTKTDFLVLRGWMDRMLDVPGVTKGLSSPPLMPNFQRYISSPKI